MTDDRDFPTNEVEMESASLMEGNQNPTGDEDMLFDDVFEMKCSEEMDTPTVPPPPNNIRRSQELMGGRVSQAHTRWTFGSGFGMRDNYTSIISQLNPSLLQASSPPATRQESKPLLTLNSLSDHDSGYIPSPSSAISFTFSEDEPPIEQASPSVTPTVTPGFTPPRDIPDSYRLSTQSTPPQDITPVRRPRSNSCPEVKRPPLPRTPIPRFQSLLSPVVPSPAHGRTCSMPATGSDGKPLLTPSPMSRTSTPRAAKDAMVDLAEEDGGSSSGHHRRVLVLSLPDIVVDTEGRDTGACTPPSSNPPSVYSQVRVRPAWQRPRALSCEVTLEEEIGQELRRIADSWSSTEPPVEEEIEEENVSVWGQMMNCFRQKISPSSLSSRQS